MITVYDCLARAFTKTNSIQHKESAVNVAGVNSHESNINKRL